MTLQEQVELLKKERDELREALSDVIDGYDSHELIHMTGLPHSRCQKIVLLSKEPNDGRKD